MTTNDKIQFTGMALVIAAVMTLDINHADYFLYLFITGAAAIIYGMVNQLCPLDKEKETK